MEHNHSGVTASCSIVPRNRRQVVQSDLQDTIWMIFILEIISKLRSAENNTCQSEEASEVRRSHWAALLLVKSEMH